MRYKLVMPRWCWVVAAEVSAAATLAGCSQDPSVGVDSGRIDSGVCMPFDLGPAAPDADGDGDGDTVFSDADDASDADAIHDPIVDAAPEAPPPFDAGAKVCRSEIDDIVFTSCSFASCHGRPGQGTGGMYLPKAEGDWYPNVVGVASRELPSMPRVSPGDPANSWLAHKLVGDACTFARRCKSGDCGDRMPQANEPLLEADLDKILRWIRQGADPGCSR